MTNFYAKVSAAASAATVVATAKMQLKTVYCFAIFTSPENRHLRSMPAVIVIVRSLLHHSPTYAIQAAVLCSSTNCCRQKAAVVFRKVAEGLYILIAIFAVYLRFPAAVESQNRKEPRLGPRPSGKVVSESQLYSNCALSTRLLRGTASSVCSWRL